jgi:hypothetical protein
MDSSEDPHWRRVPGHRYVWTVSQKPASAWDDLRVWGLARWRSFGELTSGVIRFARYFRFGFGRNARRAGTGPPRRRRA